MQREPANKVRDWRNRLGEVAVPLSDHEINVKLDFSRGLLPSAVCFESRS